MSHPHDTCPSCLELQAIIDQKEELIKQLLAGTRFSLTEKQNKVVKKFHLDRKSTRLNSSH